MVEEEWKGNFRRKREKFEKLCSLLYIYSVIKTKPIYAEKCFGRKANCSECLILYYLADEGRIWKVANAFGLGRSTVSTIIRKVTTVISTLLVPEFTKFPETDDEVNQFSSQFS